MSNLIPRSTRISTRLLPKSAHISSTHRRRVSRPSPLLLRPSSRISPCHPHGRLGRAPDPTTPNPPLLLRPSSSLPACGQSPVGLGGDEPYFLLLEGGDKGRAWRVAALRHVLPAVACGRAEDYWATLLLRLRALVGGRPCSFVAGIARLDQILARYEMTLTISFLGCGALPPVGLDSGASFSKFWWRPGECRVATSSGGKLLAGGGDHNIDGAPGTISSLVAMLRITPTAPSCPLCPG